MTKLDTETLLETRSTWAQSYFSLWNEMDRSRKKKKEEKKQPAYLGTNPLRCDSLTVLLGKIKKQQEGFFSFSSSSGGGKVSQFSVLHNNQIPHACAEETSWRRFWSSSCIGIFSHPNGSVGEPWDWTCPQRPCCSEGRRTASLLSRGRWEEKKKKRKTLSKIAHRHTNNNLTEAYWSIIFQGWLQHSVLIVTWHPPHPPQKKKQYYFLFNT